MLTMCRNLVDNISFFSFAFFLPLCKSFYMHFYSVSLFSTTFVSDYPVSLVLQLRRVIIMVMSRPYRSPFSSCPLYVLLSIPPIPRLRPVSLFFTQLFDSWNFPNKINCNTSLYPPNTRYIDKFPLFLYRFPH